MYIYANIHLFVYVCMCVCVCVFFNRGSFAIAFETLAEQVALANFRGNRPYSNKWRVVPVGGEPKQNNSFLLQMQRERKRDRFV